MENPTKRRPDHAKLKIRSLGGQGGGPNANACIFSHTGSLVRQSRHRPMMSQRGDFLPLARFSFAVATRRSG